MWLQSTAIPELLRLEEERLVDGRSHMEAICVLPIVSQQLKRAQDIVSALLGSTIPGEPRCTIIPGVFASLQDLSTLQSSPTYIMVIHGLMRRAVLHCML